MKVEDMNEVGNIRNSDREMKEGRGRGEGNREK